MISYHVRFWDTKKISDTARGRYRVRWAVDGREHCKSFAAKALAAAFLVTLKDAARDGKPFDPATGLPVKPRPAGQPGVTWYEHARAYTEMKWPGLAATSPPLDRRIAHHHHPRPDRPAPQRPPPRPPAPGAVQLLVQRRRHPPARPRRHQHGTGLDVEGIPAGGGPGRP